VIGEAVIWRLLLSVLAHLHASTGRLDGRPVDARHYGAVL
jgi:hypothetical protein